MGRTFENRRLKMAKRGDRDAKAFTRAGRHIAIAVRAGGPDPEANPALRRAIQNARAANMPKDRIQNAIEKAAGLGDQNAFEEVVYEGYGPHGCALIVVCTTDNPTRTVANIRFAFKKEGGNLGATGSVAFLFDHVGVFRLSPDGVDRDELELDLIDHGLDELLTGQDDDGKPVFQLRCAREEFGRLQQGLEGKGIEPLSSGFEWIAKSTTEVADEQAEEVLALVERLEGDDDVQQVFHNLE